MLLPSHTDMTRMFSQHALSSSTTIASMAGDDARAMAFWRGATFFGFYFGYFFPFRRSLLAGKGVM